MTCLTKTNFSVLVNNLPGKTFQTSRGIRQGDPLAPYIFVIVMELLARMIQQESSELDPLIGIKLTNNSDPIPFPSFTDDTLIFGNANDLSLHTIKNLLNKFCNISGLSINYKKSSLQVSKNISLQKAQSLAQQLNIPVTKTLEKYLGIPLISGRVNNSLFDEAITSLKKQLSKWKSNTLSQAGRSVLIQANLNSKTNYLMQSFLLPKGILDKIDQINKNFFWNKLQSDNYHPLISWERLCTPKKDGGLGFKTAEQINLSMQMKLLWRIIANPNNIWSKIITEKYLSKEPLMERSKTKTSWQFGRLLNIRDTFSKGLLWLVGNDKTINVWSDIWVNAQKLKNFRNNHNPNLKVCDLFTNSNTWDTKKLNNIFPPHITQMISNIYIPRIDIADRLIWIYNKNGTFTVKSTSSLFNTRNNNNISGDWIWKLNIAPNIKNFIWKTILDILPTTERLNRYINRFPSICSL